MPRRQPYKLDVDFGEQLHAYIREAASAAGISPAEMARQSVREARLRDSLLADRVAAAVMALAAAIEPDERFDPADDPRQEEAVQALAVLMGSLPAAQGVAQALTLLWVKQNLGGQHD